MNREKCYKKTQKRTLKSFHSPAVCCVLLSKVKGIVVKCRQLQHIFTIGLCTFFPLQFPHSLSFAALQMSAHHSSSDPSTDVTRCELSAINCAFQASQACTTHTIFSFSLAPLSSRQSLVGEASKKSSRAEVGRPILCVSKI